MHKKSYNKRESEIDIIIGKNLRRLRKECGYSQASLATETGITFQQIQKYEKGLNRVSATKLFIFAEIFKRDIKGFYNGIAETAVIKKEEVKTPQWVHCGACGYEWVAFYTPILVANVLKTKPKCCPKCHSSSAKIMMGKKVGVK